MIYQPAQKLFCLYGLIISHLNRGSHWKIPVLHRTRPLINIQLGKKLTPPASSLIPEQWVTVIPENQLFSHLAWSNFLAYRHKDPEGTNTPLTPISHPPISFLEATFCCWRGWKEVVSPQSAVHERGGDERRVFGIRKMMGWPLDSVSVKRPAKYGRKKGPSFCTIW